MASTRRVAVQMEIDQPFKRHVGVFAGIHEYARQQDHWHLVVDEWAGHALPSRKGVPSPYDGIVGRITAVGAERARRLNIPVVSVLFTSPVTNLPGVFPDYVACGKLRAEHLLARGFRNFGVLLHKADRADVVEGEAFATAVREAECEGFAELYLRGNWNNRDDSDASYRRWQRAMQAIDRWIDKWRLPIGLYIRDVDVARIVIEKCANRGCRVPDDVAIVSGNNEEELCLRPEPSITSLEVPNERIGYEAARLLDHLIDQNGKVSKRKAVKDSQTILLPPVGIVARRSTDFYAVADKLVRLALRFIDENLDQPLSIDNVADALDVSRRKLTDRFRRKLKRTVAGEIQRLRIERTRRELTTTEVPIHQIAKRVGFGSVRTLNDTFRKTVGCTPRQYRERREIP